MANFRERFLQEVESKRLDTYLSEHQFTGEHPRLHSVVSSTDHASSATSGKLLKADANGLPVDATNTDAEVAAAVAFNTGEYRYKNDLADDGTFNLPAITNCGHGVLVIGQDEEAADFTIKSDGTVSIVSASSGVASNADTDGKFCIGTSVASPCVMKNRLGSTKAVILQLWYN